MVYEQFAPHGDRIGIGFPLTITSVARLWSDGIEASPLAEISSPSNLELPVERSPMLNCGIETAWASATVPFPT